MKQELSVVRLAPNHAHSRQQHFFSQKSVIPSPKEVIPPRLKEVNRLVWRVQIGELEGLLRWSLEGIDTKEAFTA